MKTGKKFLSHRTDEGGSIIWKVGQEEDPVFQYHSHSHWIDAEVNLTDCSRTIHLDFGFDPKKPRKLQKRLQKMDILIEELQACREAMLEAGKPKSLSYLLGVRKDVD